MTPSQMIYFCLVIEVDGSFVYIYGIHVHCTADHACVVGKQCVETALYWWLCVITLLQGRLTIHHFN